MPIACLALAALAAIAVDQAHGRHVALVAALLVAVDLRAGVTLYDPLTADRDERALAAVRAAPQGRLLELPVLLPDAYAGSVYLFDTMDARRERPLGYSTAAPAEAVRTARRLRAAGCSGTQDDVRRLLGRLGVRVVVTHPELVRRPEAAGSCPTRMQRLVASAGYRIVGRGRSLIVRAR